MKDNKAIGRNKNSNLPHDACLPHTANIGNTDTPRTIAIEGNSPLVADLPQLCFVSLPKRRSEIKILSVAPSSSTTAMKVSVEACSCSGTEISTPDGKEVRCMPTELRPPEKIGMAL